VSAVGGASVPLKYRAQVLIRIHPVVQSLRRDPRWLFAYADANAVFFVLDAPENAAFVAKLKAHATVSAPVTEEDYRLP
jgi:hypothetical protein